MKELSIEEKAKAYDEVLKKARLFYKDEHVDNEVNSALEVLFPELKESEDERIRKAAIEFVRQNKSFNYHLGISKEQVIAWLEKQGEQKPAWSEEDKEMLNSFLHKLEVCDLLSNKEGVWIKNKLNSLKDRVQPQPKQEWSEEDKKIIDRIESEFLALHRGEYKNIDFNNVDSLSVLNWVRKIKSLCFYYRWKPSDEQMEALEYYMHALVCNEHKEILFGLYSDLKKLREE